MRGGRAAVSERTEPHPSGGRQHLMFPEDVRVIDDLQLHSFSLIPADQVVDPNCRLRPAHEHRIPPVGEEKTVETPEPDVTRMLAEQALGGTKGKLEIDAAEGGFIVRWKELVLIPEADRKKDRYRGEYETVLRTAVRERVEDTIELVRALLEKSRVVDRRGK